MRADDDNTLVFFSSDNGPWLSYGDHAGKTPYREGKATGFDGGTRSACILRYPGQLRAGSSSARMFCSVDMLPTIAGLAGATLPRNPIDGVDLWNFLREVPGATNPHEFYPFSTNKVFEGVFSGDGRWKLHLPHNYQTLEVAGRDGKPGHYRTAQIGLSLFDMEKDPFETTDVIAEHPDVAARLQSLAEEHRKQFYS
jgi:arylsulfatase A-like enzyme